MISHLSEVVDPYLGIQQQAREVYIQPFVLPSILNFEQVNGNGAG